MQTSFLSRLFDLVAPRQCALCGRRLAATESVVCGMCHMHLPTTGYEHRPYDNPMTRLFWGRLPVEKATALLSYQRGAQVAHMIHVMKYHNQPDLARQLGAFAARQIAESHFFDDIDVMVPMPLTRRRYWQRGYNQSRELCRGISEVTGLPTDNHAAVRIHFAGSQTQQTIFGRQENVRSAFRLADASRISGRHVLLVDDVVTTGATMTACGAVLSDAPDVRLSLLALAIVKS